MAEKSSRSSEDCDIKALLNEEMEEEINNLEIQRKL